MHGIVIIIVMLAVAAFFVQELLRWKRPLFLCTRRQKTVRVLLFVFSELCLGLFLAFPFLKTVLALRLMVWYLGTVLLLLLALTALLVCDLLMTRAGFGRK
ncbi:MAG: hypothetical protein IJT95_02190 [Abditibacteriota bacterium]|nr:hypothetical protein [Abditibacteriota bacterium]